MAALSIFVDESGDFGRAHVGYYVVSLVLHEQTQPLSASVAGLRSALQYTALGDHAVHSGAAIRGEAEYRGCPVAVRRAVLARMHEFVMKAPIRYQSFVYRRKNLVERSDLEGAIARDLGVFLRENTTYFRSFQEVVVYYDNGQAGLTRILNVVMNAYFLRVDLRRVLPADYRLFQAADFCCTMELLRAKADDHTLTRGDLYILESARKLRRNYLKKIERKRFAQP